MVGCINESEDYPYHITGAAIFFGGYDVFMLLRAASLLSAAVSSAALSTAAPTPAPNEGASRALQLAYLIPQLALALLSTLLTFLYFAPTGQRWLQHATRGVGGVDDVVGPALEWTNALTIVSYLTLAVFSHKSLTHSMGFSIAPTA